MEVTILAPTQGQIIPEIKWNFEEFKAWAEAGLKDYRGRVYTIDQLPEAKAARAKLNKALNALEDRRKDLKRTYLEPYNVFEAQVKECTNLFKSCIGEIADQIIRMEDADRAEKLGSIEDIFDAWCPEELGQFVTLENIMDPRWLNKTVSLDAIEKEIRLRINQIKAGAASLPGVVDERDLPAVMNRFYQDYDLAAAVLYSKSLKNQREALQARGAANLLSDVPAMDVEHTPPPEPAPPAPMESPAPLEDPDEPRVVIDFRVNDTPTKLNKLKAFLKENNIKYGPVPKEDK